MRKSKNSKRGFFFTVTALAMLSFMLLSMQLWLRTFEQYDQRASSRFKGEAMRMILSSISDQALSDFTSASALYATNTMAEYTSYMGQELAPVPASDANNPGTGSVEVSMRSLMFNGTTILNPLLNYSEDEIGRYTLAAWQGKIQTASNMMGFNVSFSDANNFTIKQTDPWTVRVQFNMDVDITDLDGTMHQHKKLNADANVSIAGLRDPAITRSDMYRRAPIERNQSGLKQVFRLPAYKNASFVAPHTVANGSYGSGWFFGPITQDYPGEGIFAPSYPRNQDNRMSQYILKTPFTPELPLVADRFGAILLIESPFEVPAGSATFGSCDYNVTVQTHCLNCLRFYYPANISSGCSRPAEIIGENQTKRPYIATSGDINFVDPIPRPDDFPSPQQFVLIDNQKDNLDIPTIDSIHGSGDYHRVWDVTKIRDMAICGFYVEGNGPSFFQRMVADPWSYSNSKLGIESFVVGAWAGGNTDPNSATYDSYSRLDRDFYSSTAPLAGSNMRIKGMPGCRDKLMCDEANDNTTLIGIGRFRLNNDLVGSYGLGKIACNTTNSGNDYSPCDP